MFTMMARGHPCRGTGVLAAGIAAVVLSACQPALDWRTVSLPQTGLEGVLPCRPGTFERTVRLGSGTTSMFMLSCEASGVTYGLSTAELGDSARIEPALAALLGSARLAIAGSGEVVAWQPFGATPFKGNVSAHYLGLRPDGVPVEESIQVFGRGTRIFEAMAIGRRLDPSATQPFKDGLRFDQIP